MHKFKVSVIICFFNSEKTLEAIIKDAINQTLKNKQIVLVNDGSHDGSLDIAERYAAEYDYIKIVTQKNEGIVSARNTGLKNSEGEYIIYWDSDDNVENTALEILYNRAKADKSDIVCSQVYIDFMNKGLRRKSKNPFPKYSISGEEAIENLLRTVFQSFQKGCFVTGTLWDKLIRRDLIVENNITYKDAILEDIIFIIELLLKSRKVSFVNNYFYTNYQRPGSLSSTISTINKSLKTLEVVKQIFEKENLMNKYKELYEIFYLELLFFISFKQVYTIVYNIDDRKIYNAYKKKLISVLNDVKNSEDFEKYYKNIKKRKFSKVQMLITVFLRLWHRESSLYVDLSILVYKYFLTPNGKY